MCRGGQNQRAADTKVRKQHLTEIGIDLFVVFKNGQAYIPECTAKVTEVRKAIEEQGLTCDVQVDGGIGADNLQMVLDAGANVVVAGSAVFKNDIAANVTNMLKIMGEK